MRKLIPIALIPIALLVLSLFVVETGKAQPPRWRVPDISGTWYFKGDEDKPCEIRQYRGGRALFINENGDRARGTVRPGSVWIPEWTDRGRRGLYGRIRGDRIIWPDGNFWSREPYDDYDRR